MPPTASGTTNSRMPARRSPEMRAHEFGRRKLLPDELRHDVVDRPEDHHGEEAVGIQQSCGGGEPGEQGEPGWRTENAVTSAPSSPTRTKATTPKPMNRSEGSPVSFEALPFQGLVHVQSHGDDGDDSQQLWPPRSARASRPAPARSPGCRPSSRTGSASRRSTARDSGCAAPGR